jgi:transposase
MKILQISQETLVIGIDIASEVHFARAFDWRGVELDKVISFNNNLEGFNKFKSWIDKIAKKYNKNKVFCGAEPTGHYWFGLAEFIKKSDMKLVLVNPFHVKRSKELDDNSPNKTDRKDPKTIAKLVINGQYLETYIPENVYADLRVLNDIRNKLSKDKVSIKNRVQRWLKIYFPEYTTVFKSFTGKGSMLILKNIPLPSEIKSKTAEEINSIWRNEKVRAVGMKRAEKLLEAANNSIGITEGLKSAKKELELLLAEYELKEKQHLEIVTDLEELIKKVSNSEKLLAIKGVGILTVAGVLAEVGDINRFNSAKQIQKLAGLSLVETSSGKHKGETRISKRGRSQLRQILFQASMSLVAKNEEFRELHNHYISRDKNRLKKKQSLVAISCKLIRVFYALLKNNTIYEPSKIREATEVKKQVA